MIIFDYDIKEDISNRNSKLIKQYNNAKSRKIGESFECAYCKKNLIKKQYSQAFCPPIKKGKRKVSKCKDKYWNSVDESRWRNSLLLKYDYPPDTFYYED